MNVDFGLFFWLHRKLCVTFRRKKGLCMKSTAEIVEILRHFKETRSETYGIERMALFGSAARGEQREGSDIDICVKLRKTTFRLYMSLREELERLFSAKIDLVTLHDNMRKLFRQNIERDAIYV